MDDIYKTVTPAQLNMLISENRWRMQSLGRPLIMFDISSGYIHCVELRVKPYELDNYRVLTPEWYPVFRGGQYIGYHASNPVVSLYRTLKNNKNAFGDRTFYEIKTTFFNYVLYIWNHGVFKYRWV